MIKWEVTDEDRHLIMQIAMRAKNDGLNDNVMEVAMDVTAVHANDHQLDLQKLLDFDNFNFAHDIHGIRGHIDVNTGKLTRGFLPRCTKELVYEK